VREAGRLLRHQLLGHADELGIGAAAGKVADIAVDLVTRLEVADAAMDRVDKPRKIPPENG
jgi:hypothetical protein